MLRSTLRTAALSAVTIAAALSFQPWQSRAEMAAGGTVWSEIRKDIFADRAIDDGAGMIALEAPIRAEDAATVPLTIRMPADFAKSVTALTLVIDKNPSPVVATFKYGAAAGSGDRVLSTRVRIDQYSDVRAIAETADGKLYMTSKFVKASGGCSAPASKDAEEAAKSLGRMQIKTAVAKESSGLTQEGQIMIKHPNNSGLQMDQLTGLYSPAHFVNKIEVKTGSAVVFSMEGGISISEDPNIRFSYHGNPTDVMEVHAEDSNGNVFEGRSGGNPS